MAAPGFPFATATAGQVRLPIVMTFVVAMFAATVALVWFGYVATREWRSGTNLLVERRANEALALVRATLKADMKGAWITAIVPFNATDLDEDPPVQHVPGRCAHLCAVPVSRVVRAVEAHRSGRRGRPTCSTARIARRRGRHGPRRTTRFPVVLIRDPPALAGLVAAVRDACDGGIAVHHAGAADRRDALPDRRARALRVRPIPHAAGIHGLHGQ